MGKLQSGSAGLDLRKATCGPVPTHHKPYKVAGPRVRTENLVRFDLLTESLNVGLNGRADHTPLEFGCLDLQAQELA
jgi:hypothetical protein